MACTKAINRSNKRDRTDGGDWNRNKTVSKIELTCRTNFYRYQVNFARKAVTTRVVCRRKRMENLPNKNTTKRYGTKMSDANVTRTLSKTLLLNAVVAPLIWHVRCTSIDVVDPFLPYKRGFFCVLGVCKNNYIASKSIDSTWLKSEM